MLRAVSFSPFKHTANLVFIVIYKNYPDQHSRDLDNRIGLGLWRLAVGHRVAVVVEHARGRTGLEQGVLVVLELLGVHASTDDELENIAIAVPQECLGDDGQLEEEDIPRLLTLTRDS